MRRRHLAYLLGAAAASPSLAPAQVLRGLPKIGVLFQGSDAALRSRIAWLMEGLGSAGFRSPAQVEILVRAADSDITRLPAMASALLAQSVDVVVTGGPPTVRAVRAATSSVAIVVTDLESDPLASGWIASYARPGGNLTGIFLDMPSLRGKQLQLLRDSVPGLSRVAAFWDPTTGPATVQALQAAAGALALSLDVLEVGSRSGFEAAFESARRSGARGLVILGSPLFGTDLGSLADLALSHRLAAIAQYPDFARAAGLIGYGPSLADIWRQMGTITARLLRGARAGELPIERPTRFELVVNQRTAATLGLVLPRALLAAADEVVE